MEAYNDEWFNDNYIVRLVLRDKDGLIYREEHDDMSLTDFEVLYGNISDELIEVEMKLKKDEEKFNGTIIFLNDLWGVGHYSFNNLNREEIESLKTELSKKVNKLVLSLIQNEVSNKLEIKEEL